MKYLLLAFFVATAMASPANRFVVPAPGGPAPIILPEPIAIGPAILEHEPISIGPAIIDESVVAEAAQKPLVQIVINVNKQGEIIGAPIVLPTPVDVYEPVNVVEVAPIEIAQPVLPGSP